MGPGVFCVADRRFFIGKWAALAARADDPYAFMPEPENTVQIACVGNSDLYSGFVPPVLWGNQGYSATVYASARQSLTKSYALLERVFATQSPELVVLETDMLYDHNPQEREMPRVLARQTRAKHLGQDMRNLASVFRQTGAQVTPGDFPSIRRTHGYRYSTKVTRLTMPDYMADTGEREQISAENRKTADRILQLCRENGAQLLLVELPTVTSWNAARHRGVAEFAAARELEFFGFEPAVRSNGIGRRRRFSGRRQSPECNRCYRRYRLLGAVYCPPVPSAGSARQFPLCQPSRGMGMLPPVCKRKCIKQRSDGGK